MTINNKKNGIGQMVIKDEIYYADWRNDKRHGFGTFVDGQGSMYEGQWVNGTKHGHGVEQWEYNKIIYSGEFVSDQKTGKGKFEFNNNIYEGDFVDGQFHGQGKFIFSNTDIVNSGKIYEGEFSLNIIHGHG